MSLLWHLAAVAYRFWTIIPRLCVSPTPLSFEAPPHPLIESPVHEPSHNSNNGNIFKWKKVTVKRVFSYRSMLTFFSINKIAKHSFQRTRDSHGACDDLLQCSGTFHVSWDYLLCWYWFVFAVYLRYHTPLFTPFRSFSLCPSLLRAWKARFVSTRSYACNTSTAPRIERTFCGYGPACYWNVRYCLQVPSA